MLGKIYLIVNGEIKKIVLLVEPALIDFVKDHGLSVFVGDVPEHYGRSSIPFYVAQIYLKLKVFVPQGVSHFPFGRNVLVGVEFDGLFGVEIAFGVRNFVAGFLGDGQGNPGSFRCRGHLGKG